MEDCVAVDVSPESLSRVVLGARSTVAIWRSMRLTQAHWIADPSSGAVRPFGFFQGWATPRMECCRAQLVMESHCLEWQGNPSNIEIVFDGRIVGRIETMPLWRLTKKCRLRILSAPSDELGLITVPRFCNVGIDSELTIDEGSPRGIVFGAVGVWACEPWNSNVRETLDWVPRKGPMPDTLVDRLTSPGSHQRPASVFERSPRNGQPFFRDRRAILSREPADALALFGAALWASVLI